MFLETQCGEARSLAVQRFLRTRRWATLAISACVFSSAPAWAQGADPYTSTPVNIVTPREGHTATLLATGKVLVHGGKQVNDTGAGASFVFDPLTGSKVSTPANGRRYLHTATLLNSGKVLVVGGTNNGTTTLGNAQLYDPSSNTWSTTSTSTAVRRQGHTATRLGDGRVLITGGYRINADGVTITPVLDVSVYDPQTQLTQLCATLDHARRNHTASLVGSGRVMLIGGNRSTSGLIPDSTADNSLEIIDVSPTSCSSGMGQATLGAARELHSAAALPDGRVLVQGGQNVNAGGIVTSDEIVDPYGSAVQQAAGAGVQRAKHTATLLPSGKVLIVGGESGGGGTAIGTLVYDPSNGLQTLTSSPDFHVGHTAVLLSVGRVLVTGGTYQAAPPSGGTDVFIDIGLPTLAAGPSMAVGRRAHSPVVTSTGELLVTGGVSQTFPGSQVLSSVESYDPVTQLWTTLPPMSQARQSHNAITLADGTVLVSGGRAPSGAPVALAERFDPSQRIWLTAASGTLQDVLNTPRFNHRNALLPDGTVLISGGVQSNGGPTLTSSERYDPTTRLWTTTGNLNTGRVGHRETMLPNLKVLVTGGYSGTASNNYAVHQTAEVFDSATGQWRYTLNPMGTARQGHRATLLPNGKVLVTGGGATSSDSAPIQTTEIFDPDTETWTYSGNLTIPRTQHAATVLANGRVLVSGGVTTGGVSTKTAELYDPITGVWTAIGETSIAHSVGGQLLPTGQVIYAGGVTQVGNADDEKKVDLFSIDLGFAAIDRPVVTLANDINPVSPNQLRVGEKTIASGSGFTGRASLSVKTGHPIAQLQRLNDGQVSFLGTDTSLASSFSSGTLFAGAVPGVLPGPAQLTVTVDGIPSISRLVNVLPNTPLGASTVAPIDTGTGAVVASLGFGAAVGAGAGAGATTTGVTVVSSVPPTSPPPDTTSCYPELNLDISTTVAFQGGVMVCVNPSRTGSICPTGAKLWHRDTTFATPTWVELPAPPASANPPAGQICGVTNSFSEFGARSTGAGSLLTPTVTLGVIASRSVASGDFNVSATTNAVTGFSEATGNTYAPITYSSGTSDFCSVSSSGTVHMIKAGTCTVLATEPATVQFAEATANQSFNASLASQTINFPAPSNRNYDPLPFNAGATASSGLPVTLSSSTVGVCGVTSDGVVTLNAPGTCTLTANQPGNTVYYAAAPAVTQSFTVSLAQQTISLVAIGSQVIGAGPITVSATASSGLPVSLTTQNSSVCAINGTTLTLVAVGQCVVLANQGGNTNYLPAPQVQTNFAIASAGAGGGSADIPTLPEWAVIALGCLLLAQTFKQSQSRRRPG